jgi:mono/diheme cytochrome c family protein
MKFLVPLFVGVLLVLQSQAKGQVFDGLEAAVNDPDYQLQGEYVSTERGYQVIAIGDGEFDVVLYEGGLPGAGWRGESPRRLQLDADSLQQFLQSNAATKESRQSATLNATPPPGAVVLFDGTDETLKSQWEAGAQMTEDGLLMQGATTRQSFGDYTLHLEFRTPFQPTASGQGRGNSGVYHQARYETQILDSFGLAGKNNEAGGIYSVRDPDLNMCFPPLVWQTYDIDFTAARFDESGSKLSDARVTVRLNGVIVQNDVSIPGATPAAPREESSTAGPLYLQDHGNAVRFRNIWLLPRDATQDARRPRVIGFERFFATASEVKQQIAGGRLLIESLGCRNCHVESLGDDVWVNEQNQSIPLTDLASRVRPDHLVRWLADTHAEKPGTTMPAMLTELGNDQRDEVAMALASYLLLSGDARRLNDRASDQQSAARGEMLFHTIGCVACHAAQNGKPTADASSVPLGPVGEKYTLDSLTRLLNDPIAIRPHGKMPRLVRDTGEARDIASYLLREIVLVPGREQFVRTVYRGNWDSLPDFSRLEPVGASETVDDLVFSGIEPLDGFAVVFEAYLPISSGGVYRFTVGSDDGSRVLIDDQEVVRVDGVHPYQQAVGETRLEPGVHRLRVEYFEGAGEERLTLEIEGADFGRVPAAQVVTQDPTGKGSDSLIESHFLPDVSLVKTGREWFQALRCSSCHAFEESGSNDQQTIQPQSLVTLSKANPLQGCLAEQKNKPLVSATGLVRGIPEYDLTPGQRIAIRAALSGEQSDELRTSSVDDQELVRHTLAYFNCYACHSREGWGGAEPDRDPFFLTTMQEMGNEGRVPPPLDRMGDKLRDEYVASLLNEGIKERPYMQTRMPAFGYERFQKTHQAIIRIDRDESLPHSVPDTPVNRLKSDGRTLVGNDGLACIKCHTFNGEGTPGIQAIDMGRMHLRLRPEWFQRYLLSPQQYRPGTRMPASFPDGKSVLPTIAEGEPGYQIHAMWSYLSDGLNAKAPSGLRPDAMELVPADRPILYRNFMAGLSPRGIAVGYPEKIHIAWDADRMALTRVWQNQFIDAALHWTGRGEGRLEPLGDAIVQWEMNSPFAVLANLQDPWPNRTDSEAGYRFLGYRLDRAGRPIFRYRVADATVEDQPLVSASYNQNAGELQRRLIVQSGENPLVFRMAGDTIRKVENNQFVINDQVRLQLDGVEMTLVVVGDKQELRASLPAGQRIEIKQLFSW